MLSIENSCEIGDLIREVVKVSGKTYSEVENAMFATYLYPEVTKTFIMEPYHTELDWLNEALDKVMQEAGITEVYITNAI